MRRLLPLILPALLLVPATGHAAPPKPRTHANDAAAMKAVTQYARSVEKCRSRTLDYLDCDANPPASKGILFEEASWQSYTISARSRQGRRFTIQRSGPVVNPTCTRAGRGSCPRAGTWKPKPLPVMSPAWGEEWLPHHRELVSRFEALVAVIETCRARTGALAACQDDPEVQAAARWDMLIFPDGRFDLQLEQLAVSATARDGSVFRYDWLPDGTGERNCQLQAQHLVSPCVDWQW